MAVIFCSRIPRGSRGGNRTKVHGVVALESECVEEEEEGWGNGLGWGLRHVLMNVALESRYVEQELLFNTYHEQNVITILLSHGKKTSKKSRVL